MSTSIWWIRRDMRVTDNKALQSAAIDGDVVPLFVVDPRFEKAGLARRSFMYETLRALDAATGGKLVLRYGDPVIEVPQLAKVVGASSVHVASDFAPYGQARDQLVREALKKVDATLVESDSPYCVNPGTVLKDDGTPLKVFTPFYRRWSLVDFSSAVEAPVTYADAVSHSQGYPDIDSSALNLPEAGEEAAWRCWKISTKIPSIFSQTMMARAKSPAFCLPASPTCSSTAPAVSRSAWQRTFRRTIWARSSTPALR